MYSKVKQNLKGNVAIVKGYDKVKAFYYRHLMSDEMMIRRRFKKRLGRELNLEDPIKFNDKLQWLKLYWYDPLATKCADKYEVRKIIKEKIGEEYLNELIAVYESVNEIDIDKLPDRFVLKVTNGSGYNVICEDKSKTDWKVEFKTLRRWLRTKYHTYNGEWVYRDVKPRIICEKFLEQNDGDELRDYRFFCFNGVPKFVTVDFSITDKKKTRRNLYTLGWELMDAGISYPRELDIEVNKPEKLEEMIELSKKLSSGFPHARVDFYYIDNKIIFGEITFFHQSGVGKIYPEEFEIQMGSWLELPSSKC